MLRPLRLVDQFNEIERGQIDDWAELQLRLTVADDTRAERAAALLGPAAPGRRGRVVRLSVNRSGGGIAPEGARRLLRRLDQEGIGGELELLDARTAPPQEIRKRETLRAQWERAVAGLPPDWSDVYGEARLDSTDYVERAALLLAPLNPARYGGPAGLRFRCARQFGYGASPAMVARCFERCDEEGITGEVEILHALSDTQPVGTQGPVWLVGGRVV
jgi:hypothetical protein